MLKINDIRALGGTNVEKLLLVQVGTQLYGLTKVADDTLPNAVIYETQALANPLDDQVENQ